MQYSCAYFHNENISLEQAQIDKKNHIINKLQITSDMDVLDIGCGWGGMSIEIAKQTGASVKGITLSENQYRYSLNKAKENNLIFRPHFKTHQSEDIANWFRQFGIKKCTVSSVSMAEYFIHHHYI